MATFGDLIDATLNHLSPYAVQQDKVTTLTSPILSGDTTLTVADGAVVDRGLLEIDQELMAVQSVNPGTGVVTLHPWGRAQRGTTAAAHAGNSKVTVSARFPRSGVAAKVRQVVRTLYPDLFWVKVDQTSNFSAARIAYPLPADFESVVSVTTSDVGPSRGWLDLTRWKVNGAANTTEFPTGKSIDIYDGIVGRPLRIVYRARFGELASESDNLSTVGLSDRWIDVVALGAAAHMVLSLEVVRLESDTVETQERAGSVQPTQATTVARQLLGMFKTRLAEERSVLLGLHPPVMSRRP